MKLHGRYTAWTGLSDLTNGLGIYFDEILIVVTTHWIDVDISTNRLAIGSFVEEYNNKVQVISLDEDTAEFSAKSTFDHPYPTTKIMWIPDGVSVYN